MEELKQLRLGELYDVVEHINPRNSCENFWFIEISAIDKETKQQFVGYSYG
jgi:hypothetical protein